MSIRYAGVLAGDTVGPVASAVHLVPFPPSEFPGAGDDDRTPSWERPVTAARRICVVPDLGDALSGALRSVEELFVALGIAAKFRALPVPEPLAGGVALGAAVRVAWAVAPTQSARRRVLPRLLGPDGRTPHAPLRFFEVDAADLSVLGAAAAVLGGILLPGAADGELAAVLADHARGADTTPGSLVVQLARLHGLLDLEWTDDVELLHARIAAAGPVDVVLTPAEEAAYRRTVERFDAMWAAGSGVAPFLD